MSREKLYKKLGKLIDRDEDIDRKQLKELRQVLRQLKQKQKELANRLDQADGRHEQRKLTQDIAVLKLQRKKGVAVYKVLKRHFAAERCYVRLVDLMLETTLQTELGQLLDTMCDNLTLADFSLDRWRAIVTYKTAFYSFYLSVAFAMTYAGIEEQGAYDAARTILIKMGVYFQAQDDYLDCYGTPEQIGKIGTDIESKKCGWLFCNAYNGLTTPPISPQQKALLDAQYGKCKVGSAAEKSIKALYEELNLEKQYRAYEQACYDEIMALRPTVTEVPWEVFEVFLKKIFKRSK